VVSGKGPRSLWRRQGPGAAKALDENH